MAGEVNGPASPAADGAGSGRRRSTVCVTGAGGYIGSWIVKLLLQRGYAVRATSRSSPDDPKNNHLRRLDGATERLTMVRADLLDRTNLQAAFDGCDGIFHVACSFSLDPNELLPVIVEGTKNVVNAAADVGEAAVVFTSSIGSVYMSPRHHPDQIMDESCWSDLDYCKRANEWYCYGKTVAEKEALRLAGERGVRVAIINAVVTVGPMLHSTLQKTSNHLFKYLTGSAKTYANAAQAYVDVRDVAAAHVKVFESPGAAGRFICAESTLHRGELCRIIADLFPGYPVPTRSCKDETGERKKGYRFTNRRLAALGMKFTPVRRSIYDNVVSLQEKGFVPVVAGNLQDLDAEVAPQVTAKL